MAGMAGDAPSAFGTSPKWDSKNFPVPFGGRVPERMRVVGRVGAGFGNRLN